MDDERAYLHTTGRLDDDLDKEDDEEDCPEAWIEPDDYDCSCSESGIEPEWEWDCKEQVWKCSTCGSVQ